MLKNAVSQSGQRQASSAYVRAKTEVYHLERFEDGISVEEALNCPLARAASRPKKALLLFIQATGNNLSTKKPEVMEYHWALGTDEYNAAVLVKAFGADTIKIDTLVKNDLIMLEDHVMGSCRGLFEYTHFMTDETAIEVLGKKVINTLTINSIEQGDSTPSPPTTQTRTPSPPSAPNGFNTPTAPAASLSTPTNPPTSDASVIHNGSASQKYAGKTVAAQTDHLSSLPTSLEDTVVLDDSDEEEEEAEPPSKRKAVDGAFERAPRKARHVQMQNNAQTPTRTSTYKRRR